jgi:UDPglucose--hexose-1-phosphate uridylyltransferase
MGELRKDPITGAWVIISTERQKRPTDFAVEPAVSRSGSPCPFCEGNEDKTPPEVLAYRDGSPPNGRGWQLRVVPNKYPALRVEGSLDRQGVGLFDRMNGIGAHEVIIETPEHDQTLATFPEAGIERVLRAWRDRMADLKQDRRFRYVLPFKNHGPGAGATLEHPHSQLIALPIVPLQVREEVNGALEHFADKERCVFCDIVRQELRDRVRVAAENADFVAIEPYAPRFAFETWLVPKQHGALYEEASPQQFASLARMVKDILQRMNKALLMPSYNLLVHSAPFGESAADYYHWHLEIMPRLTRVAGFEWGTGFYINPTAPEEAAEVLRDVRL